MRALANDEVGDYLNRHFVCSFQKVGTFRVVNGQKQGGNVASYFCTPDGQSVLHAVAGPVDAATLLREARWVVETRQLGQLENAAAIARGDLTNYKLFFRKAHAERLAEGKGVAGSPQMVLNRARTNNLETVDWKRLPLSTPTPAVLRALLSSAPARPLSPQGRVHLLLAVYPLAPLDQVYRVVFEDILHEQVSTRPVAEGPSGR